MIAAEHCHSSALSYAASRLHWTLSAILVQPSHNSKTNDSTEGPVSSRSSAEGAR